MSIPLVYSEEVAEAITAGQPVVALESNVITHGLDYPDNAETARRVQDAVRAGGSVPATIGIDKGRILVGLTDADIERFATTPASRRSAAATCRSCWHAAKWAPRPWRPR